MDDQYKEELSREEAAAYMDFSTGTLAVWESLRRHPLKCERRHRRIFYRRSQIDKLMGDNGTGPMLNPKKAALYLGCSFRTLEGKNSLARIKTQPARLGRSVRYRISELDKYREENLKS